MIDYTHYDPRTDSERMFSAEQWAFIDGKTWQRPNGATPPGWAKDGRGFRESNLTYAEYLDRLAESPDWVVDIPEPELQVAAVTADDRKDDIILHMRQFHRVGYMESKATKADYLAVHNRVHGVIAPRYNNEAPTKWDVLTAIEVAYREYQHSEKPRHVHSPVPTIDTDITIDTDGVSIPMDIDPTDVAKDAQEAIAKATEGGKPLSVTQRKTLEKIIDDDFSVLRGQMRTFANDVIAQRTADINAEYEKKESERAEVEQKARDLRAKNSAVRTELIQKHARELAALDEQHQNAEAAFREEARGKGFDVSGNILDVKVSGKAEALKQVQQEVHSELNRALTQAERQRLAAQRTVLLASVTPQSLALLKEIPDAKTMMLQAAKEQQAEVPTEAKEIGS